MAKSRIALALLLAGQQAAAQAAEPAPGEPLTAEQALRNYERQFGGAGKPCRPDDAGEELIVCGRREGRDPNRIPYGVPPPPGERIAGEPAPARDALALGSTRCSAVGPNQQCGGGLPVIPIAIFVVKTLVKAVKDKD